MTCQRFLQQLNLVMSPAETLRFCKILDARAFLTF